MSNVHIPTELIGYYEDYIDGCLVEVEAVLVADVPKVVAATIAKTAPVLEGLEQEAACWERAAHGNQEYAEQLYAELLQARAEIEQLRAHPPVSDQTPATSAPSEDTTGGPMEVHAAR